MIMHTEIVGLPQSGKTTQLLALYKHFENQGNNPVIIQPTHDMAVRFRSRFGVPALWPSQIDQLNPRCLLIDDVESCQPGIIEKAKAMLERMGGITFLVTTRSATPEVDRHD